MAFPNPPFEMLSYLLPTPLPVFALALNHLIQLHIACFHILPVFPPSLEYEIQEGMSFVLVDYWLPSV